MVPYRLNRTYKILILPAKISSGGTCIAEFRSMGIYEWGFGGRVVGGCVRIWGVVFGELGVLGEVW